MFLFREIWDSQDSENDLFTCWGKYFCCMFLLSWPSSCFDIETHAAREERSKGKADDRLRETDSLSACLWLFQGGLKTVPAEMPCREKRPTQDTGEGTHTFMNLLCASISLNRGMNKKYASVCTHKLTIMQTHKYTSISLDTQPKTKHLCKHTHAHNLCKGAPEVSWHVADAQFSCPHPVSRPNQSSPLHTEQQHSRRWKREFLNVYHFWVVFFLKTKFRSLPVSCNSHLFICVSASLWMWLYTDF